MFDWIRANTQWLFDGIGAGLAVALLGWIGSIVFRRDSATRQQQHGGYDSINIQAGRDANVGDIVRGKRK